MKRFYFVSSIVLLIVIFNLVSFGFSQNDLISSQGTSPIEESSYYPHSGCIGKYTGKFEDAFDEIIIDSIPLIEFQKTPIKREMTSFEKSLYYSKINDLKIVESDEIGFVNFLDTKNFGNIKDTEFAYRLEFKKTYTIQFKLFVGSNFTPSNLFIIEEKNTNIAMLSDLRVARCTPELITLEPISYIHKIPHLITQVDNNALFDLVGIDLKFEFNDKFSNLKETEKNFVTIKDGLKAKIESNSYTANELKTIVSEIGSSFDNWAKLEGINSYSKTPSISEKNPNEEINKLYPTYSSTQLAIEKLNSVGYSYWTKYQINPLEQVLPGTMTKITLAPSSNSIHDTNAVSSYSSNIPKNEIYKSISNIKLRPNVELKAPKSSYFIVDQMWIDDYEDTNLCGPKQIYKFELGSPSWVEYSPVKQIKIDNFAIMQTVTFSFTEKTIIDAITSSSFENTDELKDYSLKDLTLNAMKGSIVSEKAPIANVWFVVLIITVGSIASILFAAYFIRIR